MKNQSPRAILWAALLVVLVLQPWAAQGMPERPFFDKPVALEHIHIDSPSQFRRWASGDVPLGNYHKDFYARTRLGSVLVAPGVLAYIDAVWNKIDSPSFFELIDTTSGLLLTKVAVTQLPDAEWYFPGNGVFFLNQTHLGLCGPRHTQKFSLRGKAAPEMPQPLTYIGAETETIENTPLYESPSGGRVVTVLAAGTRVTVLGVLPGATEPREAPLLVKDPMSLTGWHHRTGIAGDGSLAIDQCN